MFNDFTLVGIIPDNPFELKSKSVKPLRLPIVFGILPVISQLDAKKDRKEVERLPKESGRTKLKGLELTLNSARLLEFANESKGIGPLKLLESTKSLSSLGKFPNSLGIVPVIILLNYESGQINKYRKLFNVISCRTGKLIIL